MNQRGRKKISDILKTLNSIAIDIDFLANEEYDKMSAMEDSLSGTEQYEQISEAYDTLTDAYSSLEECIEYLREMVSE